MMNSKFIMKRKRPLSLELEVFACAGDYRNVPGREEGEYRLELRLTNRSGREIRFDAVEVSFSGNSKGGLHVSVKDSPKGDQGALIELAGGEVWIRKVRTNGYTDEILRESLGRPVTISISINRRTLAVDGPFFGILPALEDLPYDPLDSWDTNAEGRLEGRRIMMGRAC
jgi:hypothetical protein